MRKKLLWITETAVLLALLVTLQAVTKSFGQLVTGSCVNAILTIAVLVGGVRCGVTVALISPVMAFLLGIAPNFITVFPIMLGNACFVSVLQLITGNARTLSWKQPVALAAAATAKFLVLYALVVKVICGFAADGLLGKKLGDIVVLAPPMLNMLPAMFTWPQLFTALIGGAVGIAASLLLRKALRR